MLAGDRVDGREGAGVDGDRGDAAAAVTDGGTRVVGGQGEWLVSVEDGAPVRELAPDGLAREPLLLPGREVGVLDGELR